MIAAIKLRNSGYYYMQLGCADSSTQAIAVNIYQDNQCTKRSIVDGMDDSTIDVSEIQVRQNTRYGIGSG